MDYKIQYQQALKGPIQNASTDDLQLNQPWLWLHSIETLPIHQMKNLFA